jgi:hypothetical protein
MPTDLNENIVAVALVDVKEEPLNLVKKNVK